MGWDDLQLGRPRPLYKGSSPYQRMKAPFKYLLPLLVILLILYIVWYFYTASTEIEKYSTRQESDFSNFLPLSLLCFAAILSLGVLHDWLFASDLRVSAEGIKVKYWPYRLPQSLITYHTIPLGYLHIKPLELELNPMPEGKPGYRCSALVRGAGPGGKDQDIRLFEEDPVAFLEALKKTSLGEFALKNVSVEPLLKTLVSEEDLLEFLSSSPKEEGNWPLELVRYFREELVSILEAGYSQGKKDLDEQTLYFLKSM